MNLLDLVIIALLAAAFWSGSHRSLSRQSSISGASLLGLLMGVLLYGKLAYLAGESLGRSAILILLIMAISFLFYDIILTVSSKLSKKIRSSLADKPKKLQLPTRLISAVVSSTSTLLVIWLYLAIFNNLPIPILQYQLKQSTIANISLHVAHTPDLIKKAAELLSPFGQPETFTGTEPTFDDVDIEQDFSMLDAMNKKVTPSVYKVVTWGCGATSKGTGFLVGNTFVVTAGHVVAGADRIVVQIGDSSYNAQVIAFDSDLDLAVLSTAVNLPGAPLTFRTKPAAAGTIGSVLGYSGGQTFTVGDAIVLRSMSAKGLDIYGVKEVTRSIYALRAEVTPGDSGAPLIDNAGNVMGLIFGHSKSQDHTGYALTASQISTQVRSAVASNTPTTAGTCTL